jgi:AbrB family looped-hinge helix DNA binding protein
VRVSSKGQIVIPKAIRQQLGIAQGDACEVEVREGEMVLRPVRRSGDWRRWQGLLRGTTALEEHLDEHRREVEGDRGGP